MHPKSNAQFTNCLHCNAQIRLYPSTVGRKKFCSRECQRKYADAHIEERFWSKVDRTGGPNACWEWTAGLRGPDSHRYGLFTLHRKPIGAHRFAWKITNGPIPKGMVICHKCDNPPCCNPSHLFLGTTADNHHDMEQKGRHPHEAAWNPTGEVNPKAKLTDATVIEARKRWASGGVSKSQLAREYGVSSTMMSWVILQRFWKHLPSVDELSQK